MRIAIDVMGGDVGPEVIIAAALRCAADYPDLKLDLVGDRQLIEKEMGDRQVDLDRIAVCHAPQVVEMGEKPALALRHKRQSSMHFAIGKVKSAEADACVSSGNTGALMAIGRYLLKTLAGIDRPAIIKAMPSTSGRCYLLDLGANINCEVENLIQFAAMGSLMCGAVENIAKPRVGLLNIGEEEIKGGEQINVAAGLLRDNAFLNFIGFVEGDAIYQSGADVIVCDGWVGNVALKTSEGLAKFVALLIQDAFEENVATRAAALIANPTLNKLRSKLQPEQYNGATMLGLQGVVVKSHGNTTEGGFYNAIEVAIREAEQDVPNLIARRLDEVLDAYH
jgi:glycerol-3-phosphate acyltransferase PlsX|tara:strand:+ start:320 stop:1330 length:1011 start_codon:yes stop_codon:yes gene_type:complete